MDLESKSLFQRRPEEMAMRVGGGKLEGVAVGVGGMDLELVDQTGIGQLAWSFGVGA